MDLRGILTVAATTGIQVGGVRYSGAFLTGGLFSLDGIHPTDLGSGVIANAMIDAVNAKFGAAIPHVDLADMTTYSADHLRRETAEGGAGLPDIDGLQQGLRMLFGRR